MPVQITYQHNGSDGRGFRGVFLEEDDFRRYLCGPIKDALLDREERNIFLERLQTLHAETGFSSTNLLADIQALQNEDIEVQNFRIGEACAEIILEDTFECRFHWNELRDARNPKGNKTGADLVGFIESQGQVLFLFGEVKTSSETANRPPQVMTNADGIENQLKGLFSNANKRLILINYLQNKARLHADGHPFKQDFDNAIRSYYGSGVYQLIGVLVRDVDHDENDVSKSYHKLKTDILMPAGLELWALYVPVTQSNWLTIMNGSLE